VAFQNVEDLARRFAAKCVVKGEKNDLFLTVSSQKPYQGRARYDVPRSPEGTLRPDVGVLCPDAGALGLVVGVLCPDAGDMMRLSICLPSSNAVL